MSLQVKKKELMKKINILVFIVIFLFSNGLFSQQLSWKENSAFTINTLTSTVESNVIGGADSYLLSQSNLQSNDTGFVEITSFKLNNVAVNAQSELSLFSLYFTFEDNFSLAAVHQNSYSLTYNSTNINGVPENTITLQGPNGEIDTIENVVLSPNDIFRIEKTENNKILLKYNTNEYLISDNYMDTGRLALRSSTDALSFVINNEGYRTDDPNPPIFVTDEDINWITMKTYDNAGLLRSAGVSYYDCLGKSTQSQSRDFKTGKTWASETRYDFQGRPALQTISAPLSGTALNFTFNEGLIREDDGTLLTTEELEINPENPPLLSDDEGKVGWFYSNNNTSEPYQDVAEGRPYFRTVYDELNPGKVRAVVGGKKLDADGNGQDDGFLDRNPQGFSHTMPAAQEMYYVFGQDYFDGSVDPSYGKEVILKSFKTVSIDAHGNEGVAFSDAEGKILASARSGGTTNYEVVYLIGEQGYIDIHLPKNMSGGYELLEGSGYIIYNLRTGQQLESQNNMAPGNIYRISYPNTGTGKTYINGAIINHDGGVNKGIRYSVNYYDFSLNYYDKVGRLKQSVQPSGFNATEAFNLATSIPNHSMKTYYNYNASGELTSTTSPDEGNAIFVYREDGQIRFSRNTKQAEIGDFSYTNYDAQARPEESGVRYGYTSSGIISGTTSVDFITESDVTTTTGTLTKTGLTSWDNSGFISTQSTGTGNFDFSFQVTENSEGIIGISKNDSIGNYRTVEYGIYFDNNQINLMNYGSSLARSITTYTSGDIISGERFDNIFYIKKNGKEVYNTALWGSIGELPSYILDGNIYSQGTVISDININSLEANKTDEPTYPPLPDPDAEIDLVQRKEQLFTLYDENDDAGLQAVLGLSGYRNQRFLSGNVSKTWTKNPETSTTWYSYDVYGRVEWMVQYINGLGAKTTEYEYDDATGQVTKVLYQRYDATEIFVHKYIYNDVEQLITVETSRDNVNFIEHARYTYYETGALKRTVLAEGLQGTDYVYTLGGQLKAINHSDIADQTQDPGNDQNNAFGLILDYYDKDYTRSGTNLNGTFGGVNRYDGNIKASRWATQGINTPGEQNSYRYSYNENKWLSAATFGTTHTNGLPNYSVSNLQYDANGNIISLKRTKGPQDGNNAMDNLQYNYNPNSNQLEYVADSSGNLDLDGDIKNQNALNYIYNEIGQLIRNEQDDLDYTYYATGLVSSVTSYNDIGIGQGVYFNYNDRGQRVEKTFTIDRIIQSQTFYVRDASGQVMAIYNVPPPNTFPITTIEYPMYGLSRLGIADQNNSFKYQLTDHLGNVRAVIQRDYNPVIVISDDFSSGTVDTPPWHHFSNTTVTVVNEQLKAQVSDPTNNSIQLEFTPIAHHQYKISFYVDLGQTDNDLVFGIGSNNTEHDSGNCSFNYTALTNSTVNITFGLNNNGASFQNIYFLDNVKITDVTTNNVPLMLAYKDYYPFGMPMPERNVEGEYPYAYQGQEKDSETGMEAFELRLWDARIGRWLTTDPAGQYSSPYLGMGNNPVSYVDPDGGEDNPIYGSDGNFRGVDEFGLDGAAIVYDGEFINGMSQSKILNNGGFFIGDNFDFMNGYAGNKIMNHFMNIPNRPDFDGALTLNEANSHYRSGNGDPLFVDRGKIGLFPLTVEDHFNYDYGKSIGYNFINDAAKEGAVNTTTGLIYGTLRVTLEGVNGKVHIGRHSDNQVDVYDFGMDGRFVRDKLTRMGEINAEQGLGRSGVPFIIYGYGQGRIPLKR